MISLSTSPQPDDQSDIAGALPVAQHSAVAIASHAIPAGVIIIQSSFEKNRNYPK